MTIDKTVKKKVTEEWLNVFCQFSEFHQNKLYKVIEPCLVGIELIKSPFTETYSPYFVIYPLWKKDVKANLEYPILLKDFKNEKGFQLDISFENHSAFFKDVIECVKLQIPLALDGSVSFTKLMSVLDDYSKSPPLNAAPNSYLQALLEEAKLKISLYIGAPEAQNLLDQISRKSWETNHFKACGVEVSQWFQSLQEVITNRYSFLQQIEVNKQDKKIAKLQSSVLTV
ncbi:hypothetical protein J2X69_003315 [Algoriphagus sp. 4150]|uniref:hypothetical protein n=1 Tax=Algoriphagus sp. 4150 TaxID=2817756 RepID=UPI00286791DD|nr:hypothetical protein [Algoriphagus sp. 4150]MDR7130956.1 hypothetical protein [Algoriphagus sp. 4150]